VYVGDRDFPPYEYLDEQGEPAGFNVALIRALAQELGVPIGIRLLPGSDLRVAREAAAVALFSAGYLTTRTAQFDFLVPTTTVRSSLVMRQGRSSYPLASTGYQGLRMAIQEGTPSLAAFRILPQHHQPIIVPTQSHRSSIALLAGGQVDAAVGAGASLRWHAARAGLTSAHEIPMDSRPYMLAVRKGCAAAMAHVVVAVEQLKARGVIDQIADQTLVTGKDRAWSWRALLTVMLGLVLMSCAIFAWIWTLRRTVDARTHALSAAFTEQQRLADILKSNEGRLAFAMDVIGEGVWEWNLASGDISASTRWTGTFGYRAEEVPTSYETWLAYVHSEDRERVVQAAKAHIEGRAPRFETTYRIPLKGGNWIWVLDRGRIVVRDEAGRPLKMVGTLRDITVQLAAERALHDAKDAAEEMSRLKSVFLATVSHEIRTPLNAVIGTAQLMEATPLDTDQRELVDLIRRGGDSLLALVNDVLDFTKIESGRVELDERTFDVRVLIDHAVRLVERTARGKGLRFETVIDRSVPLWLMGDDTRLHQILLNLLSNAVKFTTVGSVTLAVSVQDARADRTQLRFAVRDTGIGIPSDRLERLFQPFTQVDSSTTRRFGGTGLGLAISRRLAELMGGTVSVDTVDGQGSTFTLVMGFERAEAPKTLPVVELLSPDGPHTLRLILAEDNPVNQLVQRRMLAQLGYRCDVVGNGRELVNAFAASDYDLAFVDIQMPEMDGLEAARLLRAGGNVEIVLIALTADVTTETREACTAVGMNEYLSKPVTIEALAAVLARAESRLRAKLPPDEAIESLLA
jgi:PAS domain S-box-containing protein